MFPGIDQRSILRSVLDVLYFHHPNNLKRGVIGNAENLKIWKIAYSFD